MAVNNEAQATVTIEWAWGPSSTISKGTCEQTFSCVFFFSICLHWQHIIMSVICFTLFNKLPGKHTRDARLHRKVAYVPSFSIVRRLPGITLLFIDALRNSASRTASRIGFCHSVGFWLECIGAPPMISS